jgi:hypothetical protein
MFTPTGTNRATPFVIGTMKDAGDVVDRRHHPRSVDEVYDVSVREPRLAEEAVGQRF